MIDEQPNPIQAPRVAMSWEEISQHVGNNLQFIAANAKSPQQAYESQMSLLFASLNEILFTLQTHHPAKKIILNG